VAARRSACSAFVAPGFNPAALDLVISIKTKNQDAALKCDATKPRHNLKRCDSVFRSSGVLAGDFSRDRGNQRSPATRRYKKREQAPALHRIVPRHILECGGLPPLCSPLRGFAKLEIDGKTKMPR
jgi:hypothetical protein